MKGRKYAKQYVERESRIQKSVSRIKRFPLVPKLYLGTHLSAKLHFAPSPIAKHSFEDRGIPKTTTAAIFAALKTGDKNCT